MLTQAEKGAAFRALHARDGAFIIPNPWDIGCWLTWAAKRWPPPAPVMPSPSGTRTARLVVTKRWRTWPRSSRRPICRSAPISKMGLGTPRRVSRRRSSLRRWLGWLGDRLKMYPGAWTVGCMRLGTPQIESAPPRRWCEAFRFVSH